MMKMSLKAWRQARGSSQRSMANSLGVHINTYQKWEKEPHNISIGNALKIAKILEVSVNDIIFVNEEEDL